MAAYKEEDEERKNQEFGLGLKQINYFLRIVDKLSTFESPCFMKVHDQTFETKFSFELQEFHVKIVCKNIPMTSDKL